jgi:tetratricopeptide (TPR) repeat protein
MMGLLVDPADARRLHSGDWVTAGQRPGEGGVKADRYRGFVFHPADLSEDVDLDADQRREILYLAASMDGWTHWQVLGLSWNATSAEAREAYRSQVKVFHPDRYQGRRLGTFRVRLEQIFRRLTEARDALSDEASRTAYARKTAPPEEVARAATRRIEDDARTLERRARLARTNPLVNRVARVRGLLDRGRKAMQEQRFGDAARDFLTAGAMDPTLAEARTLAEQARRKAAGEKARDLWEKARAAELQHDLDRAHMFAEAAADADASEPRYVVYAARLALLRGALESARQRAESAVREAPSLATAHEVLGEVLAAQGENAAAKKALERALELDDRLDGARERLRKLRWSFLR